MPLYVISYDLRKTRDYSTIIKQLQDWNAARILESLWLAELKGPAGTIRDILEKLVDADDGLVVMQLADRLQWGTKKVQAAGLNWLKEKSP